jgi:hypothetical protein
MLPLVATLYSGLYKLRVVNAIHANRRERFRVSIMREDPEVWHLKQQWCCSRACHSRTSVKRKPEESKVKTELCWIRAAMKSDWSCLYNIAFT